MTPAEFIDKHWTNRHSHSPFAEGWLERIDAEIREMVTDMPPLSDWASVPDGAEVFVRWAGGNRGLYRRRGAHLTLDFDRRWLEPLPQLGNARPDNIAWLIPTETP